MKRVLVLLVALAAGCSGAMPGGDAGADGLSPQDRATALARLAMVEGTYEQPAACPAGLYEPCAVRSVVTTQSDARAAVALTWVGRNTAGQPETQADPCGALSYRVDLAREVIYNEAARVTSIDTSQLVTGACTTLAGTACASRAGTLFWSTLDGTLSGSVTHDCGGRFVETMFGGTRVP